MPSTYAPNWKEVPCVNSIAVTQTLINAGLWFKKFRPQPFSQGGSVSSIPIWSSFDMDPAYYGLKYEEQWAMTNVSFPVLYTVVAGSLPSGFTLDNVAPATGRIHVDPVAAAPAVYSFTLRATNSEGFADHAFTITVSAVPLGGFLL